MENYFENIAALLNKKPKPKKKNRICAYMGTIPVTETPATKSM